MNVIKQCYSFCTNLIYKVSMATKFNISTVLMFVALQKTEKAYMAVNETIVLGIITWYS